MKSTTRRELDALTVRVARLEQLSRALAMLTTMTAEHVKAIQAMQPVHHTFVQGERP